MQELIVTAAEGTTRKTRPIIKWTGGKYEEFSMFSAFIPVFDRYFEPFFGGGGAFFALQPSAEAFLNDKSTDLVKFYSLIHSQALHTELSKYATAWEEAGEMANQLKNV